MLCLVMTSAYAQGKLENTVITLSFKDAELQQVFKWIEKEYGASFAYSSEIGKLKVSVSFTKQRFFDAMKKIAEPNGLEFSVIGDQIVFSIKPKPQPRQKIKGEVYDEHARSGLPGATIKILNFEPLTGTVTDDNGLFVLSDLPLGRYSIEISFVGYQTRIEESIVLGAGKEVNLSIGMIEDINKLEEVVISGYKNRVVPTNQMAVVSARSISTEETERFAGSLSDPARMALSYAGVTSSNGYTNEIIVRGNSPRGLLWRLEGIEIPNPNHYGVEGSSGGFINILNSSNMARSDFFVSAFPSEFGNASSGIFDLRMRKGNADKREYSLEAATLGLRASAEGPIGNNNGSYILNYRYSLLGLLSNFSDNYDLPNFQDATFKINLPTKRNGTFSLFGLAGTGRWNEESGVAYRDATQQIVEESWTDVQHYDLAIAGATHSMSFKNNKTFLENVIALSATQNRPSSSEFNYDIMKPFLKEEGKYVNSGYRLASSLNHKFNAAHVMTAGLKLNYLTYNLEADEGLPTGSVSRVLDKRGEAFLTQGFLSWQWRPSNNWVINGGGHATHFSLNNQLLIEPRFGVEYSLSDLQTISVGMGLHSRHESIATYFGEGVRDGQVVYPNQHLKLARSAHWVLGYNLSFSNHLHVKAEAYYQQQFDVPVEDDPASSYSSINHDVSFTTRQLVNKGVGRNYGIELTLEKNYSNDFYLLTTGSLFDATYKALDGIWRNTRYNVSYAANLIGGKEFRLRKNTSSERGLGLNLRGAFTGGKRVTPIDLQQSIEAGYGVEIEEEAYSKQLSDYYRLDFSVYYKWERKKASHQLKFDVLNLLEQNIYGIRFVQAKLGNPPKIQEYSFNEQDEERSNVFPVFNYKVSF